VSWRIAQSLTGARATSQSQLAPQTYHDLR
jgi:hypothetical protein